MSDIIKKLDLNVLPLGPWPQEGVMRVVMISDTHMQHRKLGMPEGDLLIHSGDFTNAGRKKDIQDFDDWLGSLNFKHKIVVFGNHDTETDILAINTAGRAETETSLENATVLNNEIVEIEGFTVFGSPFTLDPFGIDWWAHKADFEEEMEQHMENMQQGVDIVVTHSPPHGIGDTNLQKSHCGSKAVRKSLEKAKPALHVFGHIHEGRGLYQSAEVGRTLFVNASSLSSPLKSSLSQPIVLDLDVSTKAVITKNLN